MTTALNGAVAQGHDTLKLHEAQTSKKELEHLKALENLLEQLKALAKDHSVQQTEAPREQEVAITDVNGLEPLLPPRIKRNGKRIFPL